MEKIAENKIIELCKRHNFTCEVIGIYVKIVSRNDVWYVLNAPYNAKYKINLWHTSSGNRFKLHTQDKFNDFEHVFKYIHAHDSKYYKESNEIYNFNIR